MKYWGKALQTALPGDNKLDDGEDDYSKTFYEDNIAGESIQGKQ